MEKAKVVKKYSNGKITVVWKPNKCIHAGKCVRGLSSVFDVNARPWVNMEGADSEQIIKQVNHCPSGALSILEDDNSPFSPDPIPSVNIMKNGPLIIEGQLKIVNGDESELLENKKTAFCRCGASANKPFCDGAHKKIGFEG